MSVLNGNLCPSGYVTAASRSASEDKRKTATWIALTQKWVLDSARWKFQKTLALDITVF
jgi:hypothetical protein